MAYVTLLFLLVFVLSGGKCMFGHSLKGKVLGQGIIGRIGGQGQSVIGKGVSSIGENWGNSSYMVKREEFLKRYDLVILMLQGDGKLRVRGEKCSMEISGWVLGGSLTSCSCELVSGSCSRLSGGIGVSKGGTFTGELTSANRTGSIGEVIGRGVGRGNRIVNFLRGVKVSYRSKGEEYKIFFRNKLVSIVWDESKLSYKEIYLIWKNIKKTSDKRLVKIAILFLRQGLKAEETEKLLNLGASKQYKKLRRILYNFSIRSTGAEFSSDSTGDGPNPLVGDKVRIKLNTFNWINEYYRLNPDMYFVTGVILNVEEDKGRLRIRFPELETPNTWWRDRAWLENDLDILGDLVEITRNILEVTKIRQSKEKTVIGGKSNEMSELELSPEEDSYCKDIMDWTVGEQKGLGIGTININSMDIDLKIPMLSALMKKQNLGVLGLTDTRLSCSDHSYFRMKWNQVMPGGDVFFTRDTNKGRLSGGIAILVNDFWGSRTSASVEEGTWQDRAKDANTMLELTLWWNNKRFRILVVYWPIGRIDQDHKLQLAARLEDWLVKERPDLSVDEYVMEQIMSRRKKQAELFVVLGDFNAHRHSERIDQILEADLTCNVEGLVDLVTFQGAHSSWIDYVISSEVETGSGVIREDGRGSMLSDHKPIWAFFSQGPGSYMKKIVSKKNKVRAIRPKNPQEKQGYQDRLSKAMSQFSEDSSADWLFNLSVQAKNAFMIKLAKWERPIWTKSLSAISYWTSYIRKTRNWASEVKRGCLEEVKNKIRLLGDDGDKFLQDVEEGDWICKDEMTFDPKDIDKDLEKGRNEMRGKRYKQIQEQIKIKIGEREKDSKKVFKALGIEKGSLSMKRVRDGDTIYSDPAKCQETLNNAFQQWFKSDKDLPEDLWDNIQLFEEFQTVLGVPEVPEDLARRVHAAIIGKEIPMECREELESVDEFSFPDFQNILKGCSNKSAGGPSGLTYLMIKSMSLEMQKQLFLHAKSVWGTGRIPKWMKKKSLYPIPKTPELVPDVNKVRPIMLIEVIRKLLSKIIVSRIRKILDKWKILEDNQSGFMTNKETGDAIFQFLNGKLSSVEYGVPYFYSTWDIRRAFDSVEREFLEMAMIRVGIPRRIAKILAYMDKDDLVSVLSPHLENHPLHFSTEKGCGQGDSASPLLWAIFMDIILTAVRSSVANTILTTDEEGRVVEIPDSAFADDLLMGSGSLIGQQMKSQIFCSCAAILGLEIAVDKIRAGVAGMQGSFNLIVWTKKGNEKWVESSIAMSQTNTIRYLGTDHGKSGGDRIKEASQIITGAIRRMSWKKISAKNKNLYIQGALLPKLLYGMSFGGISLAHIRTLETRISSFLRRLCNLPVWFPTIALYTPKKFGGMGFRRLSDEVQVRKYDLLIRHLSKGGDSKTAVSALLRNKAETIEDPGPKGVRLVGELNQVDWLGSLGCWLEEGGVQLCQYRLDSTSELLLPKRLQSEGIKHLGDLSTVDWHEGDHEWLVVHINCSPDDKVNFIPAGYSGKLYFQQGQVWKLDDMTFFEILGTEGLKLKGWFWKKEYSRSKKLVRKGRGSIVDPEIRLYIRVIIRKDKDVATILEERAGLGTLPVKRYLAQEHFDLDEDTFIATDGSWAKRMTGNLPWEFDNIWGGGIVNFCPTNGVLKSWKINLPVSVHDGKSFSAEVLALFFAQMMGKGKIPIHSDSKSAIAVMSAKKSTLKPLLDTISEKTKVHWVRAHSDKKGGPSTAAELANIEVDKVAGGKSRAEELDTVGIITTNLRNSGSWFVRSKGELTPIRAPIREVVAGYKWEQWLREENVKNLQLTAQFRPSNFSMDQIKSLVNSKDSFGQRGAKLKLILSKADRDRTARSGEPHLCSTVCPCGCLNCLETWTFNCTAMDMVRKRQDIWELIKKIIGKSGKLFNLFLVLHRSEQASELYRGNLSEDITRKINVALGRGGEVENSKMLMKVLVQYQTTGLAMHSMRKFDRVPSQKAYKEGRKSVIGSHRVSAIATRVQAASTSHKLEEYFSSGERLSSTLVRGSFGPRRRLPQSTLDHFGFEGTGHPNIRVTPVHTSSNRSREGNNTLERFGFSSINSHGASRTHLGNNRYNNLINNFTQDMERSGTLSQVSNCMGSSSRSCNSGNFYSNESSSFINDRVSLNSGSGSRISSSSSLILQTQTTPAVESLRDSGGSSSYSRNENSGKRKFIQDSFFSGKRVATSPGVLTLPSVSCSSSISSSWRTLSTQDSYSSSETHGSHSAHSIWGIGSSSLASGTGSNGGSSSSSTQRMLSSQDFYPSSEEKVSPSIPASFQEIGSSTLASGTGSSSSSSSSSSNLRTNRKRIFSTLDSYSFSSGKKLAPTLQASLRATDSVSLASSTVGSSSGNCIISSNSFSSTQRILLSQELHPPKESPSIQTSIRSTDSYPLDSGTGSSSSSSISITTNGKRIFSTRDSNSSSSGKKVSISTQASTRASSLASSSVSSSSESSIISSNSISSTQRRMSSQEFYPYSGEKGSHSTHSSSQAIGSHSLANGTGSISISSSINSDTHARSLGTFSSSCSGMSPVRVTGLSPLDSDHGSQGVVLTKGPTSSSSIGSPSQDAILLIVTSPSMNSDSGTTTGTGLSTEVTFFFGSSSSSSSSSSNSNGSSSNCSGSSSLATNTFCAKRSREEGEEAGESVNVKVKAVDLLGWLHSPMSRPSPEVRVLSRKRKVVRRAPGGPSSEQAAGQGGVLPASGEAREEPGEIKFPP